jgi:Ricin-type beta-trefoil lectin domain
MQTSFQCHLQVKMTRKKISASTKIISIICLGISFSASTGSGAIAETFSIGGTALNTNNQFPLKDGHPIMSTWPLSLTDNDQQFDRLPGNQLKHRSTGKCLNAYKPAVGSIVNVYPCNPSDGDQKFNIISVVNNTNQIQRAGTNLCLDMPNRSANQRIALQVCNSGNANQRFEGVASIISIPETVPARQAIINGGVVNSSIKGIFVKDISDAVKQNIIRPEVGLFLVSLLATESKGGDWRADNGLGYLGAFQIGVKERAKFAPGVSNAQFLADKNIQIKTAQGLYDEKLQNVRNSNLSVWTTEPDKQVLSVHFQGKSELYKVAYAWLTLYGVDGNKVYSKDYARAAEETAQLVRKYFGL